MGMEARRLSPDAIDEEWQLVKCRRDIRGEAKLAWRFLVETFGFQSCTVNAAAVGADQGSEQRAGLRALTALAVAGLVEVDDRDRGRGVWTVYVPKPSDVQRGLRRAHGDHQSTLFDPLDAGGGDPLESNAGSGAAEVASADVVQLPPRAPLDPSERLLITQPSPLDPSEERASPPARARSTDGRSWRTGRGGSGATNAADVLGNLGHAIAAVRLPGPRQQRDWVEQIVELIVAACDDPGLKLSPCLTIAWGVVDGRVPMAELDHALARMADLRRKGEITSSPGAYVVRRMQNAFVRHSADWSRPPSTKERAQ